MALFRTVHPSTVIEEIHMGFTLRESISMNAIGGAIVEELIDIPGVGDNSRILDALFDLNGLQRFLNPY